MLFALTPRGPGQRAHTRPTQVVMQQLVINFDAINKRLLGISFSMGTAWGCFWGPGALIGVTCHPRSAIYGQPKHMEL